MAVVTLALGGSCLTPPRLQIGHLRPERIIRLIKSVFDITTVGFLPETRLKLLVLEEYLISSVRLEAVASHTSQAVMGKLQWFQIWVWSSTQTSHSCSELIWQAQTTGAWWIQHGSNSSRLLPYGAVQKLLCWFFSCVWWNWVEQYTWALGCAGFKCCCFTPGVKALLDWFIPFSRTKVTTKVQPWLNVPESISSSTSD